MSAEKSTADGHNATEGEAEPALEKPSLLAFVMRLRQMPQKKLLFFGALAAAALLAIIALVVLAFWLLRKPPAPAPKPAPVAKEELPERPPGKPSVEERFEAIKRGDLSGIPRRHTIPAPPPPPPPPAAPSQENATPPAAAEPPPISQPATDPPPLAAPSPAAKPAPAAPIKTSPLTAQGGCEVGTANAKGSAASILDCIRYFNQTDDPGRAPAKPKK